MSISNRPVVEKIGCPKLSFRVRDIVMVEVRVKVKVRIRAKVCLELNFWAFSFFSIFGFYSDCRKMGIWSVKWTLMSSPNQLPAWINFRIHVTAIVHLLVTLVIVLDP